MMWYKEMTTENRTVADMARRFATAVSLLLLMPFVVCLNARPLLPSPQALTPGEGSCRMSDRAVRVYVAEGTDAPLEFLQADVFEGKRVRFVARQGRADVLLLHAADCLPEAYRLTVTARHVVVEAAGKAGFVYALQTLRQWGRSDGKGNLEYPCVVVQDQPQMAWRGFMLDSGRQYHTVATIKKYIDMASMLKMNVFHWHLTEGLGWRIEIKKHPRLAGVGSAVADGREQQGYYSQEEIRGIVAYADERGITVVPEIDMPGHAEAALAACPELGCFGQAVEVPKQGFTHHIFCAGKAHTLQVLKEVLDEVCGLFPSTYIHLGGDEAPKGNWDRCPDCRQRIATLGLKDSHDLQLWFSAEMASHLKAKGRKAIFWGDVLYRTGYPLPDNVAIQWWNYRGHGELALRNATRLGYPIVCSSNYYCYLNFPVMPWKGYAENRTFDLRDVYTGNPSYHAATQGNPLVQGMTCALWTDYGLTEAMLDQRLFPRILALAEQMWHAGTLPAFDVFYERVLEMKPWFEAQGYTYGPALREAQGKAAAGDGPIEHSGLQVPPQLNTDCSPQRLIRANSL